MPPETMAHYKPPPNPEQDSSQVDPDMMRWLSQQAVQEVNYHGDPQGKRPSWIQDQTIEPIPFGSLADPVSQVAFLLSSPLLHTGKSLLQHLTEPGMGMPSSFLGNQRGSTGGGGESLEELKQMFLKRGGVESAGRVGGELPPVQDIPRPQQALEKGGSIGQPGEQHSAWLPGLTYSKLEGQYPQYRQFIDYAAQKKFYPEQVAQHLQDPELTRMLDLSNKLQSTDKPNANILLKFIQGRVDPQVQSLADSAQKRYVFDMYGLEGKRDVPYLSNDAVYKALDNYLLHKGKTGEQ